MSIYHRCPKCASGDMIEGAWVADAQGVRVVVGIEGPPVRSTSPKGMSTRVHASVCGSCGFVELYANQPTELWDLYRRLSRPASAPR